MRELLTIAITMIVVIMSTIILFTIMVLIGIGMLKILSIIVNKIYKINPQLWDTVHECKVEARKTSKAIYYFLPDIKSVVDLKVKEER